MTKTKANEIVNARNLKDQEKTNVAKKIPKKKSSSNSAASELSKTIQNTTEGYG